MSNTADLIITNGRVITMDDANPASEAVAVRGNEILAVGSHKYIGPLRAKHTQLIDAGGNTVMPGLIESHVHIFMGSAELQNLDLSGVDGLDALTAAVRGFAAAEPDDKLIYANGAGYNLLGPGAYATRQELDKVLPDRPFAMMSADHHTVWANTKALELAGVLRGASVPTGSEIVMDSDGLASGELREPGAFRYVLALTRTGGRDTVGYTEGTDPSPPPTAAARAKDREVIRRGLDYCASFGITTIHNMDGNFYTLELLQELDDTRQLPVRCQSPFHMKNFFPLAKLAEANEMRRRFKSERVSSGRVKVFMDGVLESWTALTLDEYPDKRGCFGEANFTPEQFNEIAIAADKQGLQIDVHAIGDGAVRRTLDGFEAARKANGQRDSRHRIEHIELIDPADIKRFRTLGVIASMQPTHAAGGGVTPDLPSLSRIRGTQLEYAYAWSLMREVSLAMPFSSDWPVAPIDPMLTFYVAMTREPYRPGFPDIKQTLKQCIASYTMDAAFTEFTEARKGRLKPGMLADIAVMNTDLERATPDVIRSARATTTICDGKITFQRT